mmetsp:Transcript_4028/g.16829  ORF Transcript_4028/g.16829 Transcript_4028/m.16829 type:complete len:253 (-) Transcript_4028:505-1263(-)
MRRERRLRGLGRSLPTLAADVSACPSKQPGRSLRGLPSSPATATAADATGPSHTSWQALGRSGASLVWRASPAAADPGSSTSRRSGSGCQGPGRGAGRSTASEGSAAVMAGCWLSGWPPRPVIVVASGPRRKPSGAAALRLVDRLEGVQRRHAAARGSAEHAASQGQRGVFCCGCGRPGARQRLRPGQHGAERRRLLCTRGRLQRWRHQQEPRQLALHRALQALSSGQLPEPQSQAGRRRHRHTQQPGSLLR